MSDQAELAKVDAPMAPLAVVRSDEIDIQIATAKRYPRDIAKSQNEAVALATSSIETAEDCRYVVPRKGGKDIEGPNIRVAEICASCWGNIRYGAKPTSIGDKTLTAQGTCWDLEKNVAAQWEVTRRITNKEGRRYNEDMIVMTANAACSIGAREAIFRVIPKAFVKVVYEAAKAMALGDTKSLVPRRAAAVEWFRNVGIQQDRVLAKLERASLEDVTMEDLAMLTGLRTAIRDGDTSVEEAFPPDGKRADDLQKQIQDAPDDPQEMFPEPPTDSGPVVSDQERNELRRQVGIEHGTLWDTAPEAADAALARAGITGRAGINKTRDANKLQNALANLQDAKEHGDAGEG